MRNYYIHDRSLAPSPFVCFSYFFFCICNNCSSARKRLDPLDLAWTSCHDFCQGKIPLLTCISKATKGTNLQLHEPHTERKISHTYYKRVGEFVHYQYTDLIFFLLADVKQETFSLFPTLTWDMSFDHFLANMYCLISASISIAIAISSGLYLRITNNYDVTILHGLLFPLLFIDFPRIPKIPFPRSISLSITHWLL